MPGSVSRTASSASGDATHAKWLPVWCPGERSNNGNVKPRFVNSSTVTALRGNAIVRGAITPGICASRSVTRALPLASTACGSLITGAPERATISRAMPNGAERPVDVADAVEDRVMRGQFEPRLIAFGDERVQPHDVAIEERMRDDVAAVRGQQQQHVDRLAFAVNTARRARPV